MWSATVLAAALAAVLAATAGAAPAKTLFFDMEDIESSAGVGVRDSPVRCPARRKGGHWSLSPTRGMTSSISDC